MDAARRDPDAELASPARHDIRLDSEDADDGQHRPFGCLVSHPELQCHGTLIVLPKRHVYVGGRPGIGERVVHRWDDADPPHDPKRQRETNGLEVVGGHSERQRPTGALASIETYGRGSKGRQARKDVGRALLEIAVVRVGEVPIPSRRRRTAAIHACHRLRSPRPMA